MDNSILKANAHNDPSSNFFSITVENVCEMLLSGKMSFFFTFQNNSWSNTHVVKYLNDMMFGNRPFPPIAINLEAQ